MKAQHIPDGAFQMPPNSASNLASQQLFDIQVETLGERNENCVFSPNVYTPLEGEQFRLQAGIGQATSDRIIVVPVCLTAHVRAMWSLACRAERVGLQTCKYLKLHCMQHGMDVHNFVVKKDCLVSP